jgi:thymidine kinase
MLSQQLSNPIPICPLPSDMGHLTLLLGCMFAQKTTELLRRIRRFRAIGYNVLVINFKGDTRYGTDSIYSHDSDNTKAACVTTLSEVDALVRSGIYQVIVIDEGQFYSDLFSHATAWADTLPVHVVVAGLDGDSERRPFGDILRLIPMAEKVERLSALCAVCKDGTQAHFSKCIKAKEAQVAIGGADTYLPVCRAHFLG